MKTSVPLSKAVVLTGAALFTLASIASAQSLLNVKIGTTANDASADGAYQENAAAVLGSANSWWNEYAFVSTTPSGVSVVNSSGNAMAGVALTVANSTGVGSLGVAGSPPFLMNNMPYQNPGGVFNISLSGLAANTEYQFVGYAANPTYSAGALWTVTTGTLNSGITSNTGLSANIASGAGVAYSDFFVTSDASGNLAITDSSLTSTYPILQGFQLETVVVPEPGAWIMMLGGFGTLLAVRRFRR